MELVVLATPLDRTNCTHHECVRTCSRKSKHRVLHIRIQIALSTDVRPFKCVCRKPGKQSVPAVRVVRLVGEMGGSTLGMVESVMSMQGGKGGGHLPLQSGL